MSKPLVPRPRPEKDNYASVVLRGERKPTYMAGRDVRHQIGCSRGGQAGKGHRWTRLQAQRAAKKSHRRRHLARTHQRVDHAKYRRLYSTYPPVNTLGIFYVENQWWQRQVVAEKRWRRGEAKAYFVFIEKDICLSERTALRRIGALPYPYGRRVPRKVVAAKPGTTLASFIGQEV